MSNVLLLSTAEPGNNGRPASANSANMHPADHMSILVKRLKCKSEFSNYGQAISVDQYQSDKNDGQQGFDFIKGLKTLPDCPVRHENSNVNPLNMMPPANQKPAPNQSFPLSIERQTSSIPKATEDGTAQFWRYPSQPMFWNAMLRKGWRWMAFLQHFDDKHKPNLCELK
uniref:Holocytochrome c-type synthase n=1 Tax=Glossina austeni TaxID=7395 RepID=A0A1A9VDE3_GLOAU